MLKIHGWGGVTWRQGLKYEGGCRGDLLWSSLPRRAPESCWLFPVILAATAPLPSPVAGGAYTAPLAMGRGGWKKNWQMRASKVLQNSMFSFLSNFNLSLTSLRSFPAGLAGLCTCPVLQRPGTRCFWWCSPLRSGISIHSCCDNTSPWKYFSLADAKANMNPRCWGYQKVSVAIVASRNVDAHPVWGLDLCHGIQGPLGFFW